MTPTEAAGKIRAALAALGNEKRDYTNDEIAQDAALLSDALELALPVLVNRATFHRVGCPATEMGERYESGERVCNCESAHALQALIAIAEKLEGR